MTKRKAKRQFSLDFLQHKEGNEGEDRVNMQKWRVKIQISKFKSMA